ncbi:ATP synthase subunit I [Psychromonas antarctica]|uniref:ATP synthase subunit I n=1 Tax=Psychromonas antarctica TaxID=67573 RepID=UPI001EE7E03B|nr:ATP synthase subunit I [Psychromonas antarctica]MCG6201768.1 ATP synthase subunit I [Psychromonas antarctica]
MVDKLAKKSLKPGLYLLGFQLLLVLFIALILTVFFSVKSGYSGFAGGITFVLPNLIFVLMAFTHAGASKSKLIVRGFFVGEAIKIFFTVILLSVFLKYGVLSLSAFYISFLLLVISQWLAPFFFDYNNGMKNDR